MLHYLRNKRSEKVGYEKVGYAVLKIDINKAYDELECSFFESYNAEDGI